MKLKDEMTDIILWITLPIWIIPFSIYYLLDWAKHQEDYLREKKDV